MKTHLLFVLLATTLPSTIPGFQKNYEANTTVYITNEHVKRREIAEPGYNKYYPKSPLHVSSSSANIAPSIRSSLVKVRSPEVDALYTYPIYSEIAPRNLSTNYLPVDSTSPPQTSYFTPPPTSNEFERQENFGSEANPNPFLRYRPEPLQTPTPFSFQRYQPSPPFQLLQPPPLVPFQIQPQPPSLPPFPPPPPQSSSLFQPSQSSLQISTQQSSQPPSPSQQFQTSSSFQSLNSSSQFTSQSQQPQPNSSFTQQSPILNQQFVFQQPQISLSLSTEPPPPSSSQIRLVSSSYTSNTSTASPPTLTATPALNVSSKILRPITTVPKEVLNLRDNPSDIPNAIVLPDAISPSRVQAANQTIITVAINNNVIIDLKSTLKKLDVSQGGKDKESEQVVSSS